MRIKDLPLMKWSSQGFLRRKLLGWTDPLRKTRYMASSKVATTINLPDLSMAFFQSCWGFLEQEIMELLANFHSQAVFEKSLNATFLALIPKKIDAVNV